VPPAIVARDSDCDRMHADASSKIRCGNCADFDAIGKFCEPSCGAPATANKLDG
jgi:hypothetical protein